MGKHDLLHCENLQCLHVSGDWLRQEGMFDCIPGSILLICCDPTSVGFIKDY